MIYLDHAATTRPDPEAVKAMLPYLTEHYGNPSAVYREAAEAKAAVDHARDILSEAIGADPGEIYYTSGGTEADNWALEAAADRASGDEKVHIITSAVEHHAVLRTAQDLERRGASVTYLPVDSEGHVDPSDVERAIRPETVLISIMTANNETGTIEPVKEIGRIAREHGIYFHTDAVQAFGHIPLSVREIGCDLLSTSAHKLNGPKGVGFLYIRKGVKLRAFHRGGSQERGRRAGTEDVPAIVGFGKAAEIASAHLKERAAYVTGLRDELIRGVLSEVPGAYLVGDPKMRLPGNADFVLPGHPSELVLIRLDMMGICASGGAACSAGSLEPSHVLLACGLSEEDASCAIRLTIGHENTMDEIHETIHALKMICS